MKAQRIIFVYAIANFAVYIMVTIAGVLLPSAVLLSFTLLLLFAVPALVLVAILGLRRRSEPLARRILWVLVLLVAVQIAYLAYYAAGVTGTLWASGIYFSANDVLHVGMVLWLIVTAALLGPTLRDRALG